MGSAGEAPHTLTISSSHAEAVASNIRKSLAVEANDLHDDRSRTTVQGTGSEVEITISAADFVAMRAALNTWCGLLAVAEEAHLVSTRS